MKLFLQLKSIIKQNIIKNNFHYGAAYCKVSAQFCKSLLLNYN